MPEIGIVGIGVISNARRHDHYWVEIGLSRTRGCNPIA
jgi:hypothetical protein